ncbi:MAG: peptidoglycan DD-metalloendopeptidase family protein [Halanaerobium sp.]
MRRRERLTGFFIIFILLTFSAYSNSMNVGGRIGIVSNQQEQLEQRSSKQENDRVLNKSEKNFNTSVNNNDKNNDKNTGDNDNTDKNDKKTDNKRDSEQEEQVEVNPESTEAARESNSIKRDINLNDREQNPDDKREETGVFTEQREENDKQLQFDKPDNSQTPFKERNEKELIDQVKVHKVQSGETLWDIAHKHDLNIDSLIGANNISNMNSIKPGQEFKILPVKGIIYRVSPGESVNSIAGKFDVKIDTILEDNNLEGTSDLQVDQNLILRGAKPEFSYQDRLDQKFMYPINTRITSYYGPRWGRMHEGVDFAAPMGSPIRVVSSGRVVFSGWSGGYGYVVIVEHQKGLRTLYAHNSKLLIKEGQSVAKGEVIARSGNTGNSTGPHLHFEVQVNGRPENPLDYINK